MKIFKIRSINTLKLILTLYIGEYVSKGGCICNIVENMFLDGIFTIHEALTLERYLLKNINEDQLTEIIESRDVKTFRKLLNDL